MGVIITFGIDSMKIDLSAVVTDPVERKYARIKFDSIRSLCKLNDNKSVQIVFINGELQTMDFNTVSKVGTNETIDSQDVLFTEIETKLFAV